MINGVVFAAGGGTRLLPITATTPKPLIPVLDVPLIDIALASVRKVAGTVVVNVSHLGSQIAEHVADTDVDIFDEGAEPFGTGGTLYALRNRMAGTIVTFNCDTVTNLSLPDLVEHHRREGKPCTLACIRVGSSADFVTGPQGPTLVDRRQRNVVGHRFIGVACWDRHAMDELPDQRPLGLTAGLIAPLIERSEVELFVHEGFAEDAGTPRGLLRVSQAALAGDLPLAHPGVLIERSPAPAYAGPGASVADRSLGSGAIVGANAGVASGAFIEDSIVWPGETVPAIELRNSIYFKGEEIPIASPAPTREASTERS